MVEPVNSGVRVRGVEEEMGEERLVDDEASVGDGGYIMAGTGGNGIVRGVGLP